jgi:GTPase SAR1 family protein
MSQRRKVVMLGEMAVGKTSIVRRMVLDRFDGNYKGTLGHDIFVYPLSGLGPARDQSMELVIWDTDGGLGASAFHLDAAVKGASAVIIVGDVTRPRTLSTMALLSSQCDVHLPGRPVYLLFNKVDLIDADNHYDVPVELQNSPHSIRKTSAKSGDNIKETFIDAANAILRRGL